MLDLTLPTDPKPATADHEGRAHALLSASKAHIWARCEAAPTLWRHIPSTPSSRYADEGRRVAEAVEHVGKGLLAALPAGMEGAQPYLGRVAALSAGALDPVTMFEPADLGALLTAGNPHRGGTPDAAVVDLAGEGGLHVVDLKWGEGVYVEAQGNEQGLTYMEALDLWATKQRGRPLPDSTPASFWIEQPRWREESDRSRAWLGTLGSFRPLFRKLSATANRIAEFLAAEGHPAVAPLLAFAEGTHCRWCPVGVAGKCPARDARMLGALDDLDAPRPGLVPGLPVAPIPPDLIPADKLANALPLFPRIRAWMEAAESRALGLAMGGGLPGYKVVAGKLGNRAWSARTDQVVDALTAAGVAPLAPAVLISPAVAEKALGKKAAAAVLAPLVSRAPGKPALVRADDPRPPFDAATSLPALPLDEANPEG